LKILLLHKYFWPDTPPYASILRAIAERLVLDGHDVTVLTGNSAYKLDACVEHSLKTEVVNGVQIFRISQFRERGRLFFIKIINLLYFSYRIIRQCIYGHYDIVMASTVPPVILGFSSLFGAKIKGSRFFYHCMDIHPEIGRISGEFKNKYVFNFLMLIDQYTCKMADKVFVLSSDMEDSLLRRPKGVEIKTCVINNFTMPVFDFHKEEPAFLKKKGSFRVVFAGNIGRFQCLDAFVDAMKLLVQFGDIDFVFMGEGTRLSALKQKSTGIDKILFFPHQKASVAQKVIADCNLGVVSLQDEIYKYAFPSKTMAYLSEGCPLLVAVESKSKLADFVISQNIGVTAEPGSSVSIATAIKSVYKNKKFHADLKRNALNVSKKFFDSRNVLDQWSRQFT